MDEKNFKDFRFQIIKHYNDPDHAQLPTGEWVQREERVFIKELGGFVVCAPYDNHFVYLLPPRKDTWFAFCTCGSPAVLIGSNSYAHLGSADGMMLVCHMHTMTNKHADGSQ